MKYELLKCIIQIHVCELLTGPNGDKLTVGREPMFGETKISEIQNRGKTKIGKTKIGVNQNKGKNN